MRRARPLVGLVAALLSVAVSDRAQAADPMEPQRQIDNAAFAWTRSLDLTPPILAQVALQSTRRAAERALIRLRDPERRPDPNACLTGLCVADPRLDAWRGVVTQVLFTARDGATLSGRVWATREGPA